MSRNALTPIVLPADPTTAMQAATKQYAENYVRSRGMNLIANGTALLGTNYNFSPTALLTSDSPGGGGSFHKVPTGVASTVLSDELIPVMPDKTYILSAAIKQMGTPTDDAFYFGIQSVDIDGLVMMSYQACYIANTLTTLAAPLNPSDTTITLTDATNWNSGAAASQRAIMFWDYVDGKGKTWPANTYTRNTIYSGSTGAWAQGGISGNVITLVSPYSGPAHPAGTQVSNASGGGTYKYTVISNAKIPFAWTTYSSKLGTVPTDGSNLPTQFYPGTAYIQLMFLVNRIASGANDVDSDHGIGNVHLTEAPTGPAGGDLGGTYPNPTIAKDAAATTASMRTLGTAATQACAGNDTRLNPTGTVIAYAGSTPPPGWLLCDGKPYSRVTYAALYAVLGTTYGAGDGSTTFNVPDLASRTIFGVGTYGALGTSDQNVEANRDTVHSHGAGSLTNSNTNLGQQTNTSDVGGSRLRLTQPDPHSHTITGSTSNQLGPLNFPHLSLNYLIKT